MLGPNGKPNFVSPEARRAKGDDDHLSWLDVAIKLIASYQSPRFASRLLLLHRRGFTTDAVTDARDV
jgi:hypothetical protein